MKAEKIIKVFRILELESAKLTKLEGAKKFKVIKAIRQLKKVAADFDDELKYAQEKLKPENFDAIVEKLRKQEQTSNEENEIIRKYDSEVSEYMKSELEKEISLDFEPLSQGEMYLLADSNPEWNVAQLTAVQDAIEKQ